MEPWQRLFDELRELDFEYSIRDCGELSKCPGTGTDVRRYDDLVGSLS